MWYVLFFSLHSHRLFYQGEYPFFTAEEALQGHLYPPMFVSRQCLEYVSIEKCISFQFIHHWSDRQVYVFNLSFYYSDCHLIYFVQYVCRFLVLVWAVIYTIINVVLLPSFCNCFHFFYFFIFECVFRLLLGILHMDPQCRWKMDAIASHPWVTMV